MMQFFFVFLHPIIVYSNLEVRYKYHTIRKARVHHINFQNNYTDRHGIHKRRKIRQRHHGADCRPLQGNPQAFGGRPATRRTAQDSGTRRKGIAVPHGGMQQDGSAILSSALFKEEYKQMVLVKDIELYSTCEHHVMPFIGKAHVAYIPDGTITGLSKIARVVETYARRLQVQERLTVQIRDCIQDTLKPLGVAVVIEASHTCMTLRGVQKANAVTTTSAFSGIFLKDERTRNEFLNLIK